MKRFINNILIALFLIGATACDDLLQKDPPSAPSQAVFWKSKEHFDYALAACYSVQYDEAGILSQVISCLDNLTDNSYCQHDETTYGKTRTMQQGDIDPTMSGYPAQMFKLAYIAIARVHQIMYQLEQYTGEDMSADDRKFMMAQCKAIRGYYYHWLYLSFKEVPLVTELLDMDNMYMEKASRTQIYTQIMTDFDEAIAEMPDLLYSDSKVTGMLTPSALKVLKARVMIFDAYGENGMADAAKMKEVIPLLESIQGYSLADNLRHNFVSDEQLACPEIMYSVRYLSPNRNNKIDLYFGSWCTNMPSRDLVNEFECTDGLEWGVSPLTVVVDEALINTKDGTQAEAQKAERDKLYLNRDKRLSQSIFHSATIRYPEEGFPVHDMGSGNASHTGFGMLKLLQPRVDAPGFGSDTDPDVVIVRYAHVLLMIAEAENEVNGPTQKVYDAVNQIRNRSGQPDLPAGLAKEEMRKRIRKEWRVETCFEGLHYYHMKQWRMMESLNDFTDPFNTGTKLFFKPAFYFWPIPQAEIDKAGGILTQDPNYI